MEVVRESQGGKPKEETDEKKAEGEAGTEGEDHSRMEDVDMGESKEGKEGGQVQADEDGQESSKEPKTEPGTAYNYRYKTWEHS